MPTKTTRTQLTVSSLISVDSKLLIRMNTSPNRRQVLNNFGMSAVTIQMLDSPLANKIIRRTLHRIHTENAKKDTYKSVLIDNKCSISFEQKYQEMHTHYMDVLKAITLKIPRSYLKDLFNCERDINREITELYQEHEELIKFNYKEFLIESKKLHSELQFDIDEEAKKRRAYTRKLLYSERALVVSTIKQAEQMQLKGLKKIVYIAEQSCVNITNILNEYKEVLAS